MKHLFEHIRQPLCIIHEILRACMVAAGAVAAGRSALLSTTCSCNMRLDRSRACNPGRQHSMDFSLFVLLHSWGPQRLQNLHYLFLLVHVLFIDRENGLHIRSLWKAIIFCVDLRIIGGFVRGLSMLFPLPFLFFGCVFLPSVGGLGNFRICCLFPPCGIVIAAQGIIVAPLLWIINRAGEESRQILIGARENRDLLITSPQHVSHLVFVFSFFQTPLLGFFFIYLRFQIWFMGIITDGCVSVLCQIMR